MRLHALWRLALRFAVRQRRRRQMRAAFCVSPRPPPPSPPLNAVRDAFDERARGKCKRLSRRAHGIGIFDDFFPCSCPLFLSGDTQFIRVFVCVRVSVHVCVLLFIEATQRSVLAPCAPTAAGSGDSIGGAWCCCFSNSGTSCVFLVILSMCLCALSVLCVSVSLPTPWRSYAHALCADAAVAGAHATLKRHPPKSQAKERELNARSAFAVRETANWMRCIYKIKASKTRMRTIRASTLTENH